MIKDMMNYNKDFRLDWHDPDEATDGYQLKWIGKDYARLQTGTATETVIIPDDAHNKKEENKNSENLFFTGDNLEVLKHLQNAYANSIKMIYIDPPYNTGNEFVYNDTFEFTDEKLKDMLGMTDDDIKRLHTINGRSSHSAWLTFMYPRLKIAKKLLSDDGVIFISIDDNEQANLKLLCDEIFGENNFVATLIWQKKKGGSQDSQDFAKEHEYIICYQNIKWEMQEKIEDIDINDYNKIINGKNAKLMKLEKWGNHSLRSDRPTLYYSIKDPIGNDFYPIAPNGADGCWRKKPENIDNEHIYWQKNSVGRLTPYEVIYFDEIKDKGKIIKTRTIFNEFGTTTDGTKDILELFDNIKIFDYVKPETLIEKLIECSSPKDKKAIFLDFFAGSATTAHAIMKLNAEDNGNRKYIMVQLQEATQDDSEAKKHGYNSIDEISRKRIELAAKKIKDETNANIDYGFKHYYVKNADIKTINKIEEFNPEITFIGSEDMIREFDSEKSKGEDVILTTWLVDDGYKLDTQIEIKDFKGYSAFYVDNSILYLISQDWGTEQTKDLLEQLGNNKFNLNTIIIYGYSFNLESIKELQTNIKHNIDKTINVEKRY